MELTITFLKIFWVIIYYICPLVIFNVMLMVVAGQVVGRLEGWPWTRSLYYTFITGTTVGYGDISPLKGWSRFLAVFIAFCGLLLTGIIVSVAISSMELSIKESGIAEELGQNIKTILDKE
ncbi:MAG: potassium channel family protein [Verrucomicrobiota bacterium]